MVITWLSLGYHRRSSLGYHLVIIDSPTACLVKPASLLHEQLADSSLGDSPICHNLFNRQPLSDTASQQYATIFHNLFNRCQIVQRTAHSHPPLGLLFVQTQCKRTNVCKRCKRSANANPVLRLSHPRCHNYPRFCKNGSEGGTA